MASAVGNRSMATGARYEVRIILLGKTGTGKSSFGNTMLGEKKFEADMSPDGITKECACATREFSGKRLFVVDTPGFLDPNVSREDIQYEVAKSYQMTALPGPHAFLHVLEPTRFIAQDSEAVDYLNKIFNTEAIKHTIIIFTHNDEFIRQGTTIERYLGRLKADAPLKKLIDQCGQRYLSVNNMGTDVEKDATIKLLLEMITKMIAENGGQVYTSPQFDGVAKAIKVVKESEGVYNPFKLDGSYTLLPMTKEIVIEGFLRRTVGRKVAF